MTGVEIRGFVKFSWANVLRSHSSGQVVAEQAYHVKAQPTDTISRRAIRARGTTW
jgi:hypothetical protein